MIWIAALLSIAVVLSVDRSKFRTCAQTGFCQAYRNGVGPTGFDKAELKQKSNGVLHNENLSLYCLTTGAIRVRLEKGGKRWESDQVLITQDFVPFTKLTQDAYQCLDKSSVTFDREQYKLSFYRTGETLPYLVLNDRGLTYIETPIDLPKLDGNNAQPAAGSEEAKRKLEAASGRKILDWGEDGKPIYEGGDVGNEAENAGGEATAPVQTDSPTNSRSAPESFGGFTDDKPKGPTSVGFDITFFDVTGSSSISLHGLPEHATQFSLKDTDSSSGAYSEPYRLYNLDVFEYELDEPMALYGGVPFLISRDSTGVFSGLFFNNPSETFVDISTKDRGSRATRWVSESGVLEFFVFPGKDMETVLNQYTILTGRPYLPPIYALGYHQCRWNYRDQKDVEEVHEKFEEYDFPFDVIWLDIEHTDGKRYFTWDKLKFPDPIKMQNDLKRTGRRMVTIVDPHVKRDSGYFVHSEAEKLGYYLKDGTQDLEGWCWPGSSSYPDFTNAKVRSWWGDFYTKYEGATDRLATWIDMNEMSLFSGPEVTMKKTALSIDGIEHREFHNLYGFHYHQATFGGHLKARENQRPFILTRSFFAGTQRYGAIWNGDNKADWTHLRVTVPMLLSMGVAGLPFIGADVGGFFGNPDVELLVRWYESGAFQPFFRAHAHIETKRREPWLFGDEVLQQIRSVVMERYRILPYIYTNFEIASRTGMPVMRPVFGAFSGQAMETAWTLGSDILVLPVLNAGEKKITVNDVPHVNEFVEFQSGRKVLRGTTFDAPLGKTPHFQRIGSIIPKQMRLRRSSELMIHDPYSLYVAVDAQGKANGNLYLDDQISFNFLKDQQRTYIEFALDCSSSCNLRGKVNGAFKPTNKIERVVFSGGDRTKLGCSSRQGKASYGAVTISFEVDCTDQIVVVWRKPWVDVASNFELTI